VFRIVNLFVLALTCVGIDVNVIVLLLRPGWTLKTFGNQTLQDKKWVHVFRKSRSHVWGSL